MLTETDWSGVRSEMFPQTKTKTSCPFTNNCVLKDPVESLTRAEMTQYCGERLIHLLGCMQLIPGPRKCDPVLVNVRTFSGAKGPPNVALPGVGKSFSCPLDVPSGALCVEVSRKFYLALLMTELNAEEDNDSRDSPAHMGEINFFTLKKMPGCWIKQCIWDPGIVAIKMPSRISPLVCRDVKDYWGSNLDIAAILGKQD